MLTQLLDLQLDPARVNVLAPDFAGRYGFRRKPEYVRFRCARPGAPYSEMTVRADEFAAPPEGVTRAYVLDRGTLLAHQSQWVTEATPTKAVLGLLVSWPAESSGSLGGAPWSRTDICPIHVVD